MTFSAIPLFKSDMIQRTPTKSEGRSQCRRKWTRTIGRTRWRCLGPACPVAAGKPRTTRRFLEALHFFTIKNVRWRALPERFGPWNSVWKRFDRLEQRRRVRGVLRHARLDEFHGASHSDVQLDHRARACVGGRGERGQEGQALGRSRGGFTTKIHAKSDASGDIIAFDLTGGEASTRVTSEPCSTSDPTFNPEPSSATKATPARPIGTPREHAALLPLIPHKANEKNKPAFFARTLYKARARIEQGVGRLKQFKRVALRCEKTEHNFRSIVSFAAGPLLDQIRPHGLGFAGGAQALELWTRD